MALLASKKTSIKALRALVKQINGKYPGAGSFINVGGDYNILAYNNDDTTKGVRIKLDSFMECYSLTIREFYTFINDDGKRDLKDLREVRHNITCQNYLKLRDLLKSMYFEINRY